MRALGQQLAASLTTLGCYYFFGLPLAIYLGFKRGLELRGFWMGFTIALVFLNSIVGFVVVRSDWSNQEEPEESAESEWSLQSALRRKKNAASGAFGGAASPLLNASFGSNLSGVRKKIVFSPVSGSAGVDYRKSKAQGSGSWDADDDYFKAN